MSNFDSNPLICDPNLFPGKNRPNITKRDRIFHGTRRGYKALILICLVSPMAGVFPPYCLFFSISTIFRRKWGVKVGPKVLTLSPSFLHKNLNPSKNLEAISLFAKVLPLVRISGILDHIRLSKGPKTSQKALFCRC